MTIVVNISHTDPVNPSTKMNVGFQEVMMKSFVTLGEEYINQHEQSASSESLKWLQSIKALKETQYLNIINYCNFERLVARAFPFADHDSFRAALDLIILTFLLDDISDAMEGTDGTKMQYTTKEESRVINVCRGQKWTGGDESAAFIMQSIIDRTSHLNQGWMDLVRLEYIRYIQVNPLERNNRADSSSLTWPMFENTRYYAGCILPFFYMSAAMVCKGDPSDVLSTPHVQILTRLAVNHVAWFNDIIGVNKEKKEAVNNNIVFVMASEKEQTWEGALEGAIKRTNQECETFLDIEAKLYASGLINNNEDVLNYIQVLKFWMRGSMDWHFQSKRYVVSLTN